MIAKICIIVQFLILSPGSDMVFRTPVQDNGRYLEAGIPNDRDFERWFRKFQQYVKTNDRNKVADLVRFPLEVRINKVDMKMKNRKDFLDNYSLMFTKEVKDAVVNQRIGELRVSTAGVMVGKGEVWINPVEGRKGYWITGVNN